MRILVVDDSIVFRRVLSETLLEFGSVSEVTEARSGEEALSLVRHNLPDAVFIDQIMPKLTGLEVIEILKRDFPKLPIILVSGSCDNCDTQTVLALEKGALAFIRKPAGKGFVSSTNILRANLEGIIETISRNRSTRRENEAHRSESKAGDQERKLQGSIASRSSESMDFWLLAIASSTGGPEAMTKLIPKLPSDFPLPVLLVQHMPEHFTTIFADNLNNKSALHVQEARDGDMIQSGNVYIAPGGRHLEVRIDAGRAFIELTDGPPINSLKPAADVLFRSLSRVGGRKRILTIVLTGMGSDATEGIGSLRRNSYYCISQSSESCVVYGMPRGVDEAGLSDESLALNNIADRILGLVIQGKVHS